MAERVFLVVDDEQDSQLTIKGLLEDRGLKVVTADSADEAKVKLAGGV